VQKKRRNRNEEEKRGCCCLLSSFGPSRFIFSLICLLLPTAALAATVAAPVARALRLKLTNAKSFFHSCEKSSL